MWVHVYWVDQGTQFRGIWYLNIIFTSLYYDIKTYTPWKRKYFVAYIFIPCVRISIIRVNIRFISNLLCETPCWVPSGLLSVARSLIRWLRSMHVTKWRWEIRSGGAWLKKWIEFKFMDSWEKKYHWWNFISFVFAGTDYSL